MAHRKRPLARTNFDVLMHDTSRARSRFNPATGGQIKPPGRPHKKPPTPEQKAAAEAAKKAKRVERAASMARTNREREARLRAARRARAKG